MIQPPAVNPKAQRIIRWRETLSTLNDERFFDIMHIYLGEIHSPFNKDKLIEQLSSIFRKEQTKEKIISYLSEFDIKIITAVSSIKNATHEKLIEFFKTEYSVSEIYSKLLNLTERLIIYSYQDDDIHQTVIALNPLLEETLSPFINIRILLPEPIIVEHNFDSPFTLSPQFLAAFISFIYENPGMCKNNTSLRKRDAEKLEEIFPNRFKCIQFLLNSFINLGIVKIGEKGIFVDEHRLSCFARLDELKQLAYLATASAARLGRHGLQTQAQLLLDTIASVPLEGFSKTSVLHTAFLISNKKDDITDAPVQSRFSKMLESHRTQTATEPYSGDIIDLIVDSAIEFGLFHSIGKTASDEPILIPGTIFQNLPHQTSDKKGILNINAGTSITVLPGLSLAELLPLISFMNILNCNTVAEFEISRKSISRAFDKNFSPDQILEKLSLYSAYKIPQSLSMNIEEWYKSYASAILYKGYVLKVDEKNERIVENNPKVSPYINLKLAPGIYLMNIPLDSDVSQFLSDSGIEFMGNVKTPAIKSDSAAFPLITTGNNFLSDKNFSPVDFDKLEENKTKAQNLKDELFIKLGEMELTTQQKEYLSTRIEHSIIITDEQLSPDTVRMEILEADGMNYAGKYHLIENAIKHNDILEITIPNEKDYTKMEIFLGRPLLLTKQSNDSYIKFAVEGTEEAHLFSVSRINHIKIIRTSVFVH